MNKILMLVIGMGLLGGCTSITANENSTQPIETKETSSITANNNSAQPIGTKETSSIPPMSSFSFELCNVYFVLGECQIFPKQQHWGEVKEIKIINVSEIKQLQQKNSIQVYVKSQGCYGYYTSPQEEAWYPISQVGIPREGEKAQAKLIDNSVMEPKFREAFVEIDRMDGIIGGGSIFSPNDCNPIEIED